MNVYRDKKLIHDDIVDSGLLVTILFYRSLGNLNIEKGNFLKTSFTKFIIMILYRFIRYISSVIIISR